MKLALQDLTLLGFYDKHAQNTIFTYKWQLDEAAEEIILDGKKTVELDLYRENWREIVEEMLAIGYDNNYTALLSFCKKYTDYCEQEEKDYILHITEREDILRWAY